MRKLLKISMFLISSFILTSSMTSMVGAEDAKGTLEVDNRPGKTDAVAQTIKITQDMKGWIATHFDPNVIGEYLSVSELEDQKGRYFLELLSGDGKVLRRMIKSAADVKHILGEINDGSPLINYIDKHRGEINKPRAYNDNRNSNIETDQKLSKSEGTSKTQRETVANDTTENNKDKTPGKALTQTNKPETKITDTKPKLAKKVKAGNADAKHKQDTRVNSEQEAKERAEQEARAKAEQEAQEREKPSYGSAFSFTLRSSYRELSVDQVQSIPNISIRKKIKWGFYGHSTINHRYNLKYISGDNVVIDNATGLMWHQNGSDKNMIYKKAKEWLKTQNEIGYAGYHDWRLPTVEEAVTLMESSKRNGALYIDPIFSNKQNQIWTGDTKNGSEVAWDVYFNYGLVNWYHFYNVYNYVRSVRSEK